MLEASERLIEPAHGDVGVRTDQVHEHLHLHELTSKAFRKTPTVMLL
jgi:hypothetical protein